MNISYKWLKSLLEFELTPQQVAERLTRIGHAVEELTYLGSGFESVLAARALKVSKHPNADKLKLVEADYGATETLEVVCGAPNVKEGGLYPLALSGARLAGGMTVEKVKIRGVESRGMLCSEKELGLSAESAGLMELDPVWKPGTPLAEVLGREDWMLGIEVTANRGDMWSHLGVVRELQPFVSHKLRLPEAKPAESGPAINELTSVRIEDPEGCPRYMARVILEVKVGPSPRWLIERLAAVGQRSINNVVDVTNYILLELGQPLHAFDLDKLEEGRIVVRKARENEKIFTLDEVERSLGTSMTVIADGRKPVAVAGVMGDKLSEVDERTTRVLLECAYFNPVTNRHTARALGMFTEASRRFERGTDFDLMPYAVDRAARLIAEVASGKVARGVIDICPRPLLRNEVRLRRERVKRVLGVDFSEKEIEKLLSGLDFELEKEHKGLFRVKVPSSRTLDVRREVDLIEELARLWGYDRIPVPRRLELTPGTGGINGGPEWELRRKLAGMGYQEVLSSSFVDSKLIEKIYGAGRFEFWRLVAPISKEEDVLRPSLLPMLLACVRRNLNQRRRDLALFEIGNVFDRHPGEKGSGEQRRLALAVTGEYRPVHWSGPAPRQDFFALKGTLESLFDWLKVPPMRFAADSHPVLAPGTAASIVLDGEKIGVIGRLDSGAAAEMDLPAEICLAELDLKPVLASAAMPIYRPVSQFPGSRRDISILLGENTSCADLLDQVRRVSPLVAEVAVFDLYQGDRIPPGKISLALSILFQSRERTLRDEEVDRAFEEISRSLIEKFGVQPR